MSTTKETTKEIKSNTIIVAGSGDVPAEIEGHVKPGKSLREMMGIATREPKTEKPAEAKPAAPKPAAKKVVPPVAPPVDLETVANTAATAAVAALEKAKPSPPTPAEEKPTDGLTPAQAKKFAVLERMEALNPENKGKAASYAAAAKKMAAYQADWEARNKGKKFNPEDEEHDQFLADNDVTYDEDEYVEALAELKADEKAKKAIAPLEEKFKAQETEAANQKLASEIAPKAIAQAKASAKLFFGELGDEFKSILDESGTLNKEEEAKIAGANDYYPAIAQAAYQTELVAGEMKRIASGVSKIDEKNPSPLHVEIFNFAIAQEKLLKAKPEEDQLDERGRRFATSEEWAAMTPQKRAHYWHLSDDDLSKLYAVEMAEKVKKNIAAEEEKFTNLAKKRGLLNGKTQNTESIPAPARPIQPVVNHREPTPAGAIAPRMAPSPNRLNPAPEGLRKTVFGL